jgi:hypothetical protein
MYEDNCFITLTYNPASLPKSRNVDKTVLQKFIKRLRKHVNSRRYHPPYQHQPYKEIRYYACGEYGEKRGRPHYHLLIFNFDFPDKKLFKGGKHPFHDGKWLKSNDHPLYISAILSTLWPYGFSTIGEVTFDSAGYVARYVLKKILGPLAEEYYKRDYMDQGDQIIVPEFALMSRMPGIGLPWLKKYFTDVYPKDFFTLNGVKNKPPRYYDDQLKKLDPDLHVRIKQLRQETAKEEEIIRLKQKENHKQLTAKQLQRNMENETDNE